MLILCLFLVLFENGVEYRKEENEIFVEIAKWYLSLSHIKMGKIDEAKKLLNEIHEHQGYYSSKAKLILNTI